MMNASQNATCGTSRSRHDELHCTMLKLVNTDDRAKLQGSICVRIANT